MDDEIAAKFSQWCQDCGGVQERVVEALFLHATEQFGAIEIGQMLDAAIRWKEDEGEKAAKPKKGAGQAIEKAPRRSGGP